LISGCYSAQKSYERGDYDRAIVLSSKKLRKKPDDQKKIEILVNSWEISNRVDKDALNAHLSSPDPDWEQVYLLYKKLDNRQNVVKQLPKLKPDSKKWNVDFKFEDYSVAMFNAKQQAVDDMIAKGDAMLAGGGRMNARSAYDMYNKAYSYDNTNSWIKSKVDQAYLMGQTRVMVRIAPANMIYLPDGFIQQCLNKRWTNLETTWTKYYTTYQPEVIYHYYNDVLINSITMSPERVSETSYVDTKKIEDGWEYIKNPDGSIKTDSLGNKLKQTVYRDITCNIRKYTMTKDVTVYANIMIYNAENEFRIANDPITTSYSWRYEYATAKGDSRALSTTSQNLVNKQVINYPTNNEMILNTSPNFGTSVYDKVNQYKNNFQ